MKNSREIASLVLVCSLGLLASCAQVPTAKGPRDSYMQGDYIGAYREIDRILEQKEEARKDEALFRLEQGMCQLAMGNAKEAQKIIGKASRALRERAYTAGAESADAFTDYWKRNLESLARSDASYPYYGEDYERILSESLLSLIMLVNDEPDCYSVSARAVARTNAIVSAWTVESEDGPQSLKSGLRAPALARMVSGTFYEDWDEPRMGQALKNYRGAKELESLAGIDPHIQRASSSGSTGNTSPVWIYLIGGPCYTKDEGTTEIGTGLGALTALVFPDDADQINEVMLAEESTIIKAPVLRRFDNGVQRVSLEILDSSGVSRFRQSDVPVVSKFDELCEQSFHDSQVGTRARGAFRQVVTAIGSTFLAELGAAISMKQWLESADIRCWQTMPENIRAERTSLPPGNYRVRVTVNGRITKELPIEVQPNSAPTWVLGVVPSGGALGNLMSNRAL